MSGMHRMVMGTVAAMIGLAVLGTAGPAQDKPSKIVKSRPISKAEALETGKSLADALVRSDATAFSQLVDVEAAMEAATKGIEAPPQFREGFLKGARDAQERLGPTLLLELRPAVQAGGGVKATKGVEWQGRPTFLLRVIGGDGTVSYLLFLLDRRPDGRIRAVDYYSLATGELASQTARRVYLASIAQANRGILDRLLGNDQAILNHIDDLKRMALANREERAQDALTIYNALPEEVKNEKAIQVLRYSATQKLNDDAKYLEAIQDFARRFPGDPACDFLLIDGYILMKQPEKSLGCIDRLRKVLGDDAYLKVLRGNLLMLLMRLDDANTEFRAAIAEEPDLRPAYDGLLNAAVEQKRFGTVTEMLEALESQFDEKINDLSEISEFKEFLNSPEGKTWAKKHPTPKPQETPNPGDEAPNP